MSDTINPADETHECVICGETFIGWGNNPEPIYDYEAGKACDECNRKYVIAVRIGAMQGHDRQEMVDQVRQLRAKANDEAHRPDRGDEDGRTER